MGVSNWRDRLAPMVSALQPAARVAERIASLAVHVQRPTVTGIVGLAGVAVSALSDQIGNSRAPALQWDMYISRGQLIQAIREAGARVVVTRHGDGSETAECDCNGTRFWVHQSGSVSTSGEADGFFEWLRQAIDRSLPPAIEVRRKAGDRCETYESRVVSLSQFDNEQADRIVKSTLPLLDGGRCILLDGRPGVGKTTMAQIIARVAGLGRTVVLNGSIIGGQPDSSAMLAPSPSSGNIRDALNALSPGTIIVDDVDKLHLSLSKLESLRAAARLVVLTANNGQYDEVLDAALMRAGRVDEVFTIKSSSPDRESPFDRLSNAEWTEVCEWPVAYVNEVKKRLAHRPGDLRLDDLRERMARKTRSGEVLK